jgi:ParB family chromosome partitioning protein
VIRHRVGIELGERVLLGSGEAGEVAEVVGRQRQVGVQRLADRLAVVPGLGDSEQFDVLLDDVGDAVQDGSALGRGRAAPSRGGLLGRIECGLDVVGKYSPPLGLTQPPLIQCS